MGIVRKAPFGIPPRGNQGSTQTNRMVPLSSGVHQDRAWPLQVPGSSTSMTNFWPVDGVLMPRSRLSSLNTIRTLAAITGIVERTDAGTAAPEIWVSSRTRHGLLTSTGSISMASFVSAFGLGTPPTTTMNRWQYAQTFFGGIGTAGNNALVAAGDSAQTLLVLYRDAAASGTPFYSYLTSAPKAQAVCPFDNYIVAFNVLAGSVLATTRVQWCQRGNPSNWTGEGSGFEDLLDMRGDGRAIVAGSDRRFVLFTDQEVWYGVSAAYPAQFQFAPLDTSIGCVAPGTVQDSEMGIFFLANDATLRLLPRAGGPSVVISGSIAQTLRREIRTTSWGVYDARLRLYHLYAGTQAAALKGYVINVDTGEWGFENLGTDTTDTPQCGRSVNQPTSTALSHVLNEGLYYGNSTGTVFSTNSLLSSDTHGTTVTSTWRSTPIASDLPGNWKQVTHVALDYRATSKSTVTLKLSQDGGNNYESTGVAMSLASAPVSGRAEQDVYRGGAFPALELTSTSTGYEIHRLDVTLNLGGRR